MSNTMRTRRGGAWLLAALLLVTGAARAGELGPVTNLPLPRFVSLKAGEANIRRGPSLTHRIDWVFRHPGTPLVVTGEYGHWRRVVDRDGVGGWIHYALISGAPTVIVDTPGAPIRQHPNATAPLRAEAEQGAIARLDRCEPGWCRVRAGRVRGWIAQDDIWGLPARDLPEELP